jgi:arginase family enzyme
MAAGACAAPILPLFRATPSSCGQPKITISDFKFQIKEILSTLNSQLSTFWGFDVDSVCASDAPGTSAPSPIGLSSEDFVTLTRIAGGYEQTKLIEFTEANPNYDLDNRTAKLVAIAMHYSIQNKKS